MSAKRRVVVDTREQLPYTDWQDREPVSAKLDQGDYALEGLDGLLVVERKSLDDFVGCCGRERDRFERELERLREIVRWPFVVIEATPQDVAKHNYHGFMEPAAVVASPLAWALDYDVHFIWGGDRAHANAIVRRLFNVLEERVKRMRPKVRARKVKEGA